MLRIGICDDDVDALESTQRIIERYCGKKNEDVLIVCFRCGQELIDFLKVHIRESLDLIFMTIEMKKLNGIETTTIINELYPKCRIVYITNNIMYASDVYVTRHEHFILKEELEKRLLEVFEKMREVQKKKYNHSTGIRKQDIIYIERYKRKTYFKTVHSVIKTEITLNELMNLKNWPSSFVRCHNGYVVNMDRVKAYYRNMFIVQTGEKVPISRSYIDAVSQAFEKWSKSRRR